MQRAWLALLIGSLGCGFNASSAHNTGGDDAGSGSDAGVIDSPPVAETCWKLNDTSDGTQWSACTKQSPGAAIEIAANTVINTDDQTSQPTGLKCTVISTTVGASDHVEICALFATSIKIDVGVMLSAKGQLPLALFASTIDVEGTIDVASHKGTRGPASNVMGCNPSMTLAKQGGGGAGGSWVISNGGAGGDQNGAPGSGGPRGNGISSTFLRGGCDGRRGGDGSPTGGADGSGGPAGGAVWLATNAGTITLGATSVINASGAGGAGGAAPNHGGSGGGTGGLIVLSSKMIVQDPTSQIFANGGHGGGGGNIDTAGEDGGDPTSVHSTGAGGAGGGPGNSGGGDGGQGYPSTSNITGGLANMGGGGGGGGGPGMVRVDTDSVLLNAQISPNPKIVGN